MPLQKKGRKKVARKRGVGRPRGTASGSPEVMEKILSVARKHFAGRGLNGTNLKDIAAESKVANSLLTYHFKGKEGLFEAAVISVAKTWPDEIGAFSLKDPASKEELKASLTQVVEMLLNSSLRHHDIFKALQREVRDGNALAIEVSEATYLKFAFELRDFFERVQNRGLIRADVDPICVTLLLFTSTCDNVENDHLTERYLGKTMTEPTWRKEMSRQIVNLFMGGVTQ